MIVGSLVPINWDISPIVRSPLEVLRFGALKESSLDQGLVIYQGHDIDILAGMG